MYEAAMDAAIQTENRNVTVSLFLVSVSLNTSTKDKSLSWRGLSALSFYREGRALHTQHAKHTAGNTHRHRRAWGRGLENLAGAPFLHRSERGRLKVLL